MIGPGQKVLTIWTGVVQRSAMAVLVAIVSLTALAGWYTATFLAINTSTTDMISADTPFRQNAIEFDAAFPQFKDLIVAVIDAPIPEAAHDAADKLAEALRGKPELFDRVDQPGRNEYFARHGLLFLDEEALSALADRLATAEPLLASLAQKPDLTGFFEILMLALQEGGGNDDVRVLLDKIALVVSAQAEGTPSELSWRELIALDGGNRQIVLAGVALDAESLAPGSKALSEIRRAATHIGINTQNGTTMRLTGSVALDYEELESAALGGKTAGLTSLVLVVLLLIIGLRSFSLILPAMITLLAGLIWTAAFAALTVGYLNLISVAFAVLFVGLGIDFSIHYCLRYREALGDKASSQEPLQITASDVGGSLAIGSICAALGFLSFLPTDYKGLAELGLISAGGMVIAFLMNVTLLPALLSVFPAPAHQRPGNSSISLNKGGYKSIVIVAVMLGIGGGWLTLQARFDFNPMNLKDATSESVTTFNDLARDSRNGIYAIDLLAPDIDTAKSEASRLKQLSAVGNAITIDSLVPNGQAEKLSIIEDMAFFLAPALTPASNGFTENAEGRRASIVSFQRFLQSYLAAAQPNALAESAQRTASALSMLFPGAIEDAAATELEHRLTVHLKSTLDDLRQALEAGPVTIDDLPQSIKTAWTTADGRARVQIWPAAEFKNNSDLRQYATTVLAAAPTAVGTPITITEAGLAVVRAFQEATIFAFIMVSVVLFVVLRRLTDVVLIMFPLILAAIFTGATAVILALPFNFANVIVLPLLFGLGVASGVHLVTRARHATNAYALMHTSTPRAVLFSALTTIASFGSLALSGHPGMTSMGQLLTIAIVYTLFSTLIILPALMAWVERREAQ